MSENTLRLHELVRAIPKVELHLHVEGTLEADMAFRLAKKNNVELRHKSVEDLREAYNFTSLQSFLDLYYELMGVLLVSEDYTELLLAYLRRAHTDNVRHCEVFFDPQAHESRGVSFETVLSGLERAIDVAQKEMGISCTLIMCFMRDLGSESAMDTLTRNLERISSSAYVCGVGLDSAEVGFPPKLFKEVFARAREAGLRCVAHAGEEGPASSVTEALDTLCVERIDHGVRCLDDMSVVERLVRERIGLTVCPSSNVELKVVSSFEEHPLKRMLELSLLVSVNADDPSYFKLYCQDNWLRVCDALSLTETHIFTLARNGIETSFASDSLKERLREELERVEKQFTSTAE